MIEYLEKMKGARVLIVGDLMLDTYVTGKAERISPEAPVPILRVESRRAVLGGAANVAANVAGIGGDPYLVGLIGSDTGGQDFVRALQGQGLEGQGIVESSSRPTTIKTRLIAQHHQFARFDEESDGELLTDELEKLWSAIDRQVEGSGAIILSDYKKGVITRELCARLITKANDYDIPVLVDPKGLDYSKYDGAYLLTPNEREAFEAASARGIIDKPLEGFVKELRDGVRCECLLVTRGEKGMLLIDGDDEVVNLEAHERKVFDVTGAGDTVIAALGAAIACGIKVREAASIANLAAGSVVERLGTSAVRIEDLDS